jgi:hypothetical protein
MGVKVAQSARSSGSPAGFSFLAMPLQRQSRFLGAIFQLILGLFNFGEMTLVFLH